jgi:hypothetical protein
VNRKDDAGGSVLASGHRLEAHRNIDVLVGASGRDDHVEVVGRGALNQRAASLRGAGNLLDRPLAGDRHPTIKCEIEPQRRRLRRREAGSERHRSTYRGSGYEMTTREPAGGGRWALRRVHFRWGVAAHGAISSPPRANQIALRKQAAAT